MVVNFLTKPVLTMNSSDLAKLMQEGAKRSRVMGKKLINLDLREGREITPERVRIAYAEIFNKDGNLNASGEQKIIKTLNRFGYDSDAMMDVTLEEYLERCLCESDPSYVPRLDIMG